MSREVVEKERLTGERRGGKRRQRGKWEGSQGIGKELR